jgi:hypothetical protein
MPGQRKANNPNTMATSPRRASTHQFLARMGSTGCPVPPVLALVVMMCVPLSLSFAFQLCYSFWLKKSRYSRVKNAVSAAAM